MKKIYLRCYRLSDCLTVDLRHPMQSTRAQRKRLLDELNAAYITDLDNLTDFKFYTEDMYILCSQGFVVEVHL